MDLLFLKNLMNGDELLVDRFVEIFRKQSRGQVAALKPLLIRQQWEELSNAAHSLKTQFNYLGLETFATQVKNIEENVDNGDYHNLDKMIDIFEDDFRKFYDTEFPC
ncbi:Hpt domain-containing protein [Dyadobacter diqingensis]|uniref:Hpt domain-containing protein n=1 Tax=Dyadobacter diqingensis TaxID=2938121 RepID=UPI0020C1A218|nr:Hpt domain-containing protein [Dyadobacter diqingensis]